MENAIGLLCQLLRAIVFEAKEDSALPVAMRTLKISWWRLTGRKKSERPVDALAVKISITQRLTTSNQEMLAHLKTQG